MEGKLLSRSPYGYTLENGGDITDTENFTRLTTDGTTIDVKVFGRKGKPKDERTFTL